MILFKKGILKHGDLMPEMLKKTPESYPAHVAALLRMSQPPPHDQKTRVHPCVKCSFLLIFREYKKIAHCFSTVMFLFVLLGNNGNKLSPLQSDILRGVLQVVEG